MRKGGEVRGEGEAARYRNASDQNCMQRWLRMRGEDSRSLMTASTASGSVYTGCCFIGIERQDVGLQFPSIATYSGKNERLRIPKSRQLVFYIVAVAQVSKYSKTKKKPTSDLSIEPPDFCGPGYRASFFIFKRLLAVCVGSGNSHRRSLVVEAPLHRDVDLAWPAFSLLRERRLPARAEHGRKQGGPSCAFYGSGRDAAGTACGLGGFRDSSLFRPRVT